ATERQPERAPRRADRVTPAEERLVRARHDGDGVLILSDQIGRHRQVFDIGRVELRVDVRGRQCGESFLPGVPLEGLSARFQCVSASHRSGLAVRFYAVTVWRTKSNDATGRRLRLA